MNNLFTEHVFTNFLKRYNTVRGINSKRIPLISSYILIPNSSKIRVFVERVAWRERTSERACQRKSLKLTVIAKTSGAVRSCN